MDSAILTFNDRDRMLLEAVAESWLTFWELLGDDVAGPQEKLVADKVELLEKALWA